MTMIRETVATGIVEGEILDDRFAPLLDVFKQNFDTRDEKGASLCITLEGKTVVDLWGGAANPREDMAWERDALSVIFSCTKGALALCANMLIDEGKLDPNAPVTDLWPEYGAAGKENTTLQMMLDHTAGVPVFRDPVPKGALTDWGWATTTLAAQEPFFEPGTRSAYHGITFSWTVGEMIRRASGKSAGAFFAERVTKPLGLDFWIGAPEDISPRLARIFRIKFDPKAPMTPFMQQLMQDKDSLPHLFYNNAGGFNGNKPEYWQAEIGGATGVSNARSLAGMYAPLACGGSLNGVKLVSSDALVRMQTVTNATHDDATLRGPMRVAAGFMTSRELPNDPTRGTHHYGRSGFGHSGSGGSMGFADPEAGMSFGYVMNQQGATLNPRGQGLINGAYEALDWKANAHHWAP